MDTDVIVVFLERYGWAVIAVLMSMVEIAPIKVNPWSAILKYLGGKLNGELSKDVKDVKDDVKGVQEQVVTLGGQVESIREESERVEAKQSRIRILRFDDELLQGVEHTKDHFKQTLEDIDIYEQYCEEHPDFKNGVARHAITHIRDTYDKIEAERRFL